MINDQVKEGSLLESATKEVGNLASKVIYDFDLFFLFFI